MDEAAHDVMQSPYLQDKGNAVLAEINQIPGGFGNNIEATGSLKDHVQI